MQGSNQFVGAWG